MTTLVLKTAGSVIGGALFGPLGAAVGGALGAVGGYYVDQQLFGSSQSVEGSSLSDLTVQTSTEGTAIPRLYGRARLTGQVIWSTNLVEEVTTRKQRTGASKGGSGSSTTTTTYSYFANFAVGLCEGEIAYIGRVWANGSILDMEDITYRVYCGTEDQTPDSLIEAKQGTGKTPAYRGLAYVVFEDLPLEDFGNRIPQLSFEVVRPIGRLEKQVQSVVMIPGATEFGYDTTEISRKDSEGEWSSENRHSYEPGTDFEVSLDHLISLCPDLSTIALVVSWFGSDLRAGECSIRPKTDNSEKVTTGDSWTVAGLVRSEAQCVTLLDGRASYGGTPSDASVLRAIAAIRERGLKVVLYPFIMMDIASGNALPDPYGEEEQAAFPWRGRITCYPGPDEEDTADLSSDAASQVNSFYAGQDWSYRRFIMHYAQLASDAGGVDGFLLGSELRGMTCLRDASGDYPFVSCLQSLASEVRALVGDATKLTYGADWSEYFGHHPQDGSVTFHLDPLWSDSNIDAIGIDNYMPQSDWRAGEDHLDANLADTGLEADYLQANIAGGEGFDWYYASDEDRDSQTRTPITDGSAGKPWVFRYKDLVSWWSNEHYNRDVSSESDTPTSWEPCSKPIWFTEIGCPAVHLGPNQPNVFPDAKSSESALPYHSSGARCDAAQRAMLTASLDYWQSGDESLNPTSPIYDDRMVADDQIYLWAWDARPFPAFPLSSDTWSDGDAWHTGHWLNGRLGNAPLQDIVRTVMRDFGLDAPLFTSVPAVIDGFVIDQRTSVRSALESLCDAFNISFVASQNRLRFELQGRRTVAEIEEDQLVDEEDEALLSKQLDPWEEEPSSVTFSFNELFQDYRQSVARYDQPSSRTRQESSKSLSVISSEPIMVDAARNWLRQRNYSRHTIKFNLPLSMLSLEAGDLVTLQEGEYDKSYRIDEIEDGTMREVSASLIAPRNSAPLAQTTRLVKSALPQVVRPVCFAMDLPLIPGKSEYPHAPYLASYSSPWPGSFELYQGSSDVGFVHRQSLDVPAIIGTLQTELAAIECYSWDRGSSLEVKLNKGDLSSIEKSSLLSGANAAAVQTENGEWEIIQFANAELIGTNLWRLSLLLRGQLGTEAAAQNGALAGARFVLIDEAIVPLQVDSGQLQKSLPFRVVANGAAISDANNIDISIDIVGRGLRPLAPVHLKAVRNQEDASLQFSWIRRDRLEADSWVDSAIPLSEAEELYQIRIVDPQSGSILRSEDVSAPNWLYSLEEQASDGISQISKVQIEIEQVSRRYGSGAMLSRQVLLDSLRIQA
ncbi:glycoside hydrolase/phage tail family protein [uncultured Cohaesibacter sp.]|uniref:baseplate multidomain protein megatron n=1 Tax=uncultured Cohaesibacter sp. TaxID=1002546 RepID=UPI0029C7B87F|nr:glycoside hydrolase/phage tail family protein [uncultured Cohaesibacter sp.]